MSVKLIRVSNGHVELIQQLAYEIWPDTFREILSQAQIDYMLNWMYAPCTLLKNMEDGHQFWLIYVHNKPVGFIGVQVNYPQAGELKIHKLYVLPQQQGLGLGKLLVEQAIELARQCNCTRIILNVNRFNKAVSFYTHIGFEVLYTEDIDIGEGYLMEDYVMGFVLKP